MVSLDLKYDKKDLYGVLGIERSASKSQIKSAYRKLAKQFHPDYNDHINAEEVFRDINFAYQTLSDETKRSNYDKYGFKGINGPSVENFIKDIDDIFEATKITDADLEDLMPKRKRSRKLRKSERVLFDLDDKKEDEDEDSAKSSKPWWKKFHRSHEKTSKVTPETASEQTVDENKDDVDTSFESSETSSASDYTSPSESAQEYDSYSSSDDSSSSESSSNEGYDSSSQSSDENTYSSDEWSGDTYSSSDESSSETYQSSSDSSSEAYESSDESSSNTYESSDESSGDTYESTASESSSETYQDSSDSSGETYESSDESSSDVYESSVSEPSTDAYENSDDSSSDTYESSTSEPSETDTSSYSYSDNTSVDYSVNESTTSASAQTTVDSSESTPTEETPIIVPEVSQEKSEVKPSESLVNEPTTSSVENDVASPSEPDVQVEQKQVNEVASEPIIITPPATKQSESDVEIKSEPVVTPPVSETTSEPIVTPPATKQSDAEVKPESSEVKKTTASIPEVNKAQSTDSKTNKASIATPKVVAQKVDQTTRSETTKSSTKQEPRVAKTPSVTQVTPTPVTVQPTTPAQRVASVTSTAPAVKPIMTKPTAKPTPLQRPSSPTPRPVNERQASTPPVGQPLENLSSIKSVFKKDPFDFLQDSKREFSPKTKTSDSARFAPNISSTVHDQFSQEQAIPIKNNYANMAKDAFGENETPPIGDFEGADELFAQKASSWFGERGFETIGKNIFADLEIRPETDVVVDVKIPQLVMYVGDTKDLVYSRKVKCHACRQYRTSSLLTCTFCNGSGLVSEDVKISVQLPITSQNLVTRRFLGFGNADAKSDLVGDLIVNFRADQASKFFSVDELGNLHVTVHVDGLKINLERHLKIPTLGGMVKISMKEISTDEQISIDGYGLGEHYSENLKRNLPVGKLIVDLVFEFCNYNVSKSMRVNELVKLNNPRVEKFERELEQELKMMLAFKNQSHSWNDFIDKTVKSK